MDIFARPYMRVERHRPTASTRTRRAPAIAARASTAEQLAGGIGSGIRGYGAPIQRHRHRATNRAHACAAVPTQRQHPTRRAHASAAAPLTPRCLSGRRDWSESTGGLYIQVYQYGIAKTCAAPRSPPCACVEPR
jgi:hypothetical protein